MAVVDDQRGRGASTRFGKPQDTPHARRQWVKPTWERLETPMEVTMYAGRR